MNIRSLPFHFDEFPTLLSNLNVDVKVIVLSEIKLRNDVPLTLNIDIADYKFHHNSSISDAGGLEIYVRSDLATNKRYGLSFCNTDFEEI